MILKRDVWVYSTSGTTSRTSEIYIPADLFKRQLDVQPLNTQVTKTIKKASTVFPSHHSHLFATFHCSPKDAFSDLSNEVTFRKESTFPTSICITTSHFVEEWAPLVNPKSYHNLTCLKFLTGAPIVFCRFAKWESIVGHVLAALWKFTSNKIKMIHYQTYKLGGWNS